ncbi:hypothetical protein [Gryllotalpicola sp.]|uniref:hypothetical protein n=1 Tax=Gryllotalpicola sp. TaxID=1932787 RepID=UPI002630DFA5|nr:hypothetical protein [Gryllotalpicola sp.]
MPEKFVPEMESRALRMPAGAIPEHEHKSAAVGHVAGVLGMSPEMLRMWARRVEIDAGRVPGPTSDLVEENRRLRGENAELRTANEVLKAASVFFAKELDRPSTR